MPLILPGNVATELAGTTYGVANSCRFNLADSAYMQKTQVAPTSQQKWTYSGWLKKCENSSSAHQVFFAAGTASDSIYFDFKFKTDDTLDIEMDSTTGGSTTALQTATTFLFRDPAAWYHVVVAVDSTQSTAADRSNLYVNGVKLTGPWAQEVYPPEDHNFGAFAADSIITVGRSATASNQYFNGYMAEVVFIDGTQYAASDFGEFDEDSPTIWKPKDVSGLTFGNNGFYLDFEDSSNLGNDANGGTDLSENNIVAADQATDTPTNNFCTINPLDNYYCGATLSEGNNSVVTGSSPYAQISSTLAVSAGKWYWEVKPSAGNYWLIGAASTPAISTTDHAGYSAYSNAIYFINGNNYVNNVSSAYAASYTTNDIISVALDLDNNKLYYAKNGDWGTGSGAWDSSTFDAAVGAITITAPASTTTGIYFPVVSDYWGSGTATFQCNFGGCPAFAISSGNADANSYGNFEYAVPSGFYAICTKNLAEFGG